MYDKSLTLETLISIEKSLCEVLEWTVDITTANDFATTPTGMMMLNAVCMKLLAIGEEIKGLDRRTDGEFLKHYPSIPWKQIKGMRDIIAHHYFSVDAAVIFSVLKIDVHPLLEVIRQMTADLRREEVN